MAIVVRDVLGSAVFRKIVKGGGRGKIEVLNNMGGAYNLGCLKKVNISREARQMSTLLDFLLQ